jgi:hypothetical protein
VTLIGSRLNRLESIVERQVSAALCAACAQTPRCVFVNSVESRERFHEQMCEHGRKCTCRRPFHVKVITRVRAVSA